jgi:vitamin B12 transporter
MVGINMKRHWHALAFLLMFFLMIPQAAAAGILDGETVVLDSKDIAELNVRTVQELLNLVPGVKAGSSTVSIRGDSAVAVILDGMSLINTASAHRSVKWNLVSLEDIASLKIIKGGGAVAFGDNSAGGVILIKSKRLIAPKRAWSSRRAIRIIGARAATPAARPVPGEWPSTETSIPLTASEETVTRMKDGPASNWPTRRKAGSFGPARMPRAPTLAIDYGETRKGSPGLPTHPTPHARSRDEALGASFNFKALAGRTPLPSPASKTITPIRIQTPIPSCVPGPSRRTCARASSSLGWA